MRKWWRRKKRKKRRRGNSENGNDETEATATAVRAMASYMRRGLAFANPNLFFSFLTQLDKDPLLFQFL